MGMFSLLDAVLDRPMEEILKDLPLAGDIRATLLGEPSKTAGLPEALELARAYEAADWQKMKQVAKASRVPFIRLARAYVDAVHWSDQIFKY